MKGEQASQTHQRFETVIYIFFGQQIETDEITILYIITFTSVRWTDLVRSTVKLDVKMWL